LPVQAIAADSAKSAADRRTDCRIAKPLVTVIAADGADNRAKTGTYQRTLLGVLGALTWQGCLTGCEAEN